MYSMKVYTQVMSVGKKWNDQTPRYEMSDLHRHVLRKNQRYLLNNIFINEDFYAELINNDLINDSMLEDIKVGGSTA